MVQKYKNIAGKTIVAHNRRVKNILFILKIDLKYNWLKLKKALDLCYIETEKPFFTYYKFYLMNKITLLATGILILFITACEKSPEEAILGTWKVDDIESTANMTDDEAEFFQAGIDEQKQMLSYTFNADKMTMKYGDDETQWSWMLNNSSDSLKLNLNNEDRKLEFFVKELTNEKMVWEDEVYGEYVVTTTLKKADTSE